MTEGRRKRHQLFKTAYGNLYSDVSRILREADPIGLIVMGAPDDEYDPEVSFVGWFGTDIAGPLTAYADVAERIWGTWLDCSRRG